MRASSLTALLLLLTPLPAGAARPCSTPACKSAKAGIAYLAQVMDEFHNQFPVYDDLSSAGNVLAQLRFNPFYATGIR
jgi:hypothetical protein